MLKYNIKQGSIVTLLTKDGRLFSKKIVKHVDEHYLLIQDALIQFEDIQSIETREHSTGKSIGLVALLFVLFSLSDASVSEPEFDTSQ